MRVVLGRHLRHAMLAMDSSSSQLLLRSSSSNLSNSGEGRRGITHSSGHGNGAESGDSPATVEVELHVDDDGQQQLERCRSPHPEVVATEEANGRNADFSEHQFVHSSSAGCREELDLVEELHNTLDPEKDVLERSACQTAAGRALWGHVIHDPLAAVLAGRQFIQSLREKLMKDQANKSRELAGVMLAVRTLWFDSLLETAIRRFPSQPQVVLLGAGSLAPRPPASLSRPPVLSLKMRSSFCN